MSTDTNMKTCTKCGQTFPATLEYFYRARKEPDGFKHWCKKCWRQNQLENKERISEYHRQYHAENKDEVNKRKRHIYYKKNNLEIRDRINENRYGDKEAQEKHKREYLRVYRLKHKEHQREYHREYNRKNKAANKIHWQKRRARKLALPDTFTKEQWLHSLDYFNGCCAVCGRQLRDLFGTHTAAADHWIPLSYKGEDNPGTVAANIVPLCHGEGGCNNSKGSSMPDVWLVDRFGKSKAKTIMARIESYFEWVKEYLRGFV